jgi:hypothetical protein
VDLERLYKELLALYADVKRRTEEPVPEYTKGYLDALRYVIEIIEEEL